MIKLIAVDMDGTFLNSQSKYNEVRFKEIHSRLDEKGIHFVVASGNQYYQLKDFFTDYDDIDYVAEMVHLSVIQKRFMQYTLTLLKLLKSSKNFY